MSAEASEAAGLWAALIAMGTVMSAALFGVLRYIMQALGMMQQRQDKAVKDVRDELTSSRESRDKALKEIRDETAAGRESDEKRRFAANRELWIELRRMDDSAQKHRDQMMTLLKDLPTRQELHEAIARQANHD